MTSLLKPAIGELSWTPILMQMINNITGPLPVCLGWTTLGKRNLVTKIFMISALKMKGFQQNSFLRMSCLFCILNFQGFYGFYIILTLQPF